MIWTFRDSQELEGSLSMKVQQVTHEVRLQQWERIVQECRSSGKPIKTWCHENQINIKTYYHWQKLVCQATCQELTVINQAQQPVINTIETSRPVFAEVSMPESRAPKLAVSIKHTAMQIDIYCGADVSVVKTVMEAFRNLC